MFKKKVANYMETHDNFVSEWYWRKKYNSLAGELELLKEVMRDDIYKNTIKKITQPMELTRYKRENTRLRTLLSTTREERNSLILENKQLKKELNKRLDENGSIE